MKSWLQDNNMEMYSTYNQGKSIVPGRFIRTLKSNIYKDVASVSKNVYIGKLADIVNEYSNTYHSKIKMKPADVKSSTFIDFDIDHNNHVRISKYKHIFPKGYAGLKTFTCLKTLKIRAVEVCNK